MTELVLIAAVAENRAIGRDNQLLWHIPEDMAHFRTLTAGQTVIMGRKTWESLPPRFRPLPGRRNIVISRQADYPAPGAKRADSLENALALASTAGTAFIIGGEQIYRQALPLAFYRRDTTTVARGDSRLERRARASPATSSARVRLVTVMRVRGPAWTSR